MDVCMVHTDRDGWTNTHIETGFNPLH